MADLNKLRQTKEYQGIANIHVEAEKYDGDTKENKYDHLSEASKYYNETMNPSKYTKDDIEQTKQEIVNKITKHFDDTLFEMICEEMGKRYVFQHENYLTEAGYDVFEDEWFEFFHEHHGDILFKIKKEL